MKVGPVLILVLVISNIAHSQAGQHGQSGSAVQGSLTVTATVESSVWLVDPDGKREIVVANAPDPKESFSQPRSLKRKSAAPAALVKQPAKTKEPARQDDAAVQFTFPTSSKQFEVTKKTVVMDVSEGGKTERRPVVVTTVVAQ
jgi:hypothetical protein